MYIDITCARFPMRIQYEYTQTESKEGASDVNVNWRTTIIMTYDFYKLLCFLQNDTLLSTYQLVLLNVVPSTECTILFTGVANNSDCMKMYEQVNMILNENENWINARMCNLFLSTVKFVFLFSLEF